LASDQNRRGHEIKKENDNKEIKPQSPADHASAEKTAGKPVPAKPASQRMEVVFIDGSCMKLTLRDEFIELNTPYGKLLIPVRDIERIEYRDS
jgi:hypothetical protein